MNSWFHRGRLGWRVCPERWLALVLGLALLTVGLGFTRQAAAGNDRQEVWRYRVPITVAAVDFARSDKTVEVGLDFGALLGGRVEPGALDLGSLRVVEVTPDGRIIDEAVPFQYDPTPGTVGQGTLIFQMTGETAATAVRQYAVTFGAAGEATTLAAAAPAAPASVTLTNVTDEGFAAYRIATPHAVYIYHKDGGGFSRLVDDNGLDWIGWHATGTNGGDYRGIPNMVHPANGGFFHPGRTTASSQVVGQGAMKVTIESTSDDGKWKTRWEIFPDFARMTAVKVDGRYWFLYEGTPGGLLEKQDFIVRSSQQQSSAFGKWSGDLQGEEWVYIADPTRNRSIFLVHHTQDNVMDSYRASDDKRMTIFGFGRLGNRRFQQQVGDQFSFGLVNSTNYATVAQTVHDVLDTAAVTVGAVETR